MHYSPSKNKIGLFIINYGNDEITTQCIKSFQHEEHLDTIVLNNQNPNSRLKDNLDKFKVIQMDKNFGYFGALIEYGRKVQLDYEWYVLSNNDILLKSKFTNIIQKLEKKYERLGVIAPSIKETNGKELNPHLVKPLSQLEKIYFNIYFKGYYIALLLRWLKQLIIKKNRNFSKYNRFIFSANGAMLILHRTIFNEILKTGNLGFLYGEEILVAETCKRKNKKIFFTDEIKLLHYHSETTGKNYSKKKFDWQKEAFKDSLKKKYLHYKL